MNKIVLLLIVVIASYKLQAQAQIESSPIYYKDSYVGLNYSKPISPLHISIGGADAEYPTDISRGDVVYYSQSYNNALEIGNSRGFNARRAWILARHSSSPYLMHYSTLHLQPDIGNKTYYKGVAIGFPTNTTLPNQTHLAVAGNVGIGTDAPNAKLDVKGMIKATEIKVQAQTADFVFEEDYQLKELSEVEEFITTNKHLPDIPSAKQMEENGVGLAEMNKLLLQKVEELTLYTIEQGKLLKNQEVKIKGKDKRISVLESRLDRLESLILKSKN
ncbi:hypothetical protein DF185_22585 [Marinifilum breve]|uniref:Uncharacterized protein n=1 Tax=Marinifilum breve TaxID=2184082 RepID=A0A2V3ZR38_9BACT|nr:hypothetical protein [Marinifilum breve]PXX95169.1 hypothetical protein DF185_22585 [Marinifilum breve]